MWLRYLVTHFVQNAAREQLQAGAAELLRQHAGGASEPGSPIPCDIAFIFAMSAESGGLVDLLEDVVVSRSPNFLERRGRLEGRGVVIAEVGVGAEAAARGTADCIAVNRPRWVVSTGFAGGLTEPMRKGHILFANEILDEAGRSLDVGLKFDAAAMEATRGFHAGRLLTVDRLIGEPAEKQALGEKYRAAACDMESFAVADVCRQAGTRFLSVRVISDAMEDRLPPEIEKLLQEKSLAGRIGTAAGAIFQRFSAVKDMWRLYEDGLRASQRLAKVLKNIVPRLD